LSNREANIIETAKHKSKHHKFNFSCISLLIFGYANRAEVKIEFLGNTALVEQMFAIEYDYVGGFAAILALDENVTVAEAAACLRTDINCALLLLDELLVKIEVICLKNLATSIVNRDLK
jgi:hypothetical protein